MHIFSCDEKIKSYTYPVIKIVISIILIILLINRDSFINIDNLVIKIISLMLGIISILCIYISASEMFILYYKRKEANINSKTAINNIKEYTIDDLLSLLVTNDIIDITTISNNQILKIGSASDCHVDSLRFFDKIYYVNKKEFSSIEAFKEEILYYFPDKKIYVIAIDDISVAGN